MISLRHIRRALRTGQYDLLCDPWRMHFSPLMGVVAGGRRATASSTQFVSTVPSTNRSGAYWVGFEFTVGSSAISVSDLGRVITATGNKNRTIRIWNFSSYGAYAVAAEATINTNGASIGAYVYGSITPVTLSASTKYVIVSNERDNDLGWADVTALSTTAVATINKAKYSASASPGFFDWSDGTSGSYGYAGVNFKYS